MLTREIADELGVESMQESSVRVFAVDHPSGPPAGPSSTDAGGSATLRRAFDSEREVVGGTAFVGRGVAGLLHAATRHSSRASLRSARACDPCIPDAQLGLDSRRRGGKRRLAAAFHDSFVRRLVTAVATAGVATVAALAVPAAAIAHEDGKALPRISGSIEPGPGLVRVLAIRLVDADSGRPISDARVEGYAEMRRPHVMRTYFDPLPEQRSGLYRGRVRFSMPARWTLHIVVTGSGVTRADATLMTRVQRASAATASAVAPDAREAAAPLLPTRTEQRLSDRDFVSMAVLWAHGAGALAWLVGVLVLTLLLGPSWILAPAVRDRFARPLLRAGGALHLAGIVVVVATGIYNLREVMPFPLVWNPAERERLASVPYGELYMSILLVKLLLFAIVVVAATRMLVRLRRVASARGALVTLPHALGLSGAVYLVAIPLLLAAAMALRYVHVLAHVASVLETGSRP